MQRISGSAVNNAVPLSHSEIASSRCAGDVSLGSSSGSIAGWYIHSVHYEWASA